MSDDHVTEVEEFDATLDLRSAIPMQIIILSLVFFDHQAMNGQGRSQHHRLRHHRL